MNNTIPGILLFTSPTKFTKQSSTSPNIYTISFNIQFSYISQDEYQLVGTRSGTEEFDFKRVREYLSYKQNIQTMDEIIFKNYTITDLNDYYKNSWKSYYNAIMKKWFGDNLINPY